MVVIGIVRASFEAKQKGRRATRNRIHPEGLDGDSRRIEPALDERLPLDLWCLHEPNESVRIHSPLYERHWHFGFKTLVTPRRHTSDLLSRGRTRRGSHIRVVTSPSVEVVISTSVARSQESMAESPGGRRRTGRRNEETGGRRVRDSRWSDAGSGWRRRVPARWLVEQIFQRRARCIPTRSTFLERCSAPWAQDVVEHVYELQDGFVRRTEIR